MNAPTIARAHDGFEFCHWCHQGMSCGFSQPRKCLRAEMVADHGLTYIVDAALKHLVERPLVIASDRDALCLDLMTDAQALATWERMKAVRKAYVEAVLQEIAE